MASNIRVVLEVDNKKYIADIKSADATTQAFGRNAGTSIDRAGSSFDNITRRAIGLRSALAGLAFGAVGRGALQMADDLQDLSNSTGIAVGRLLELKDALTTSGGQADQLPQAITSFMRSIDEAASGSIKAQVGFQKLNVSLADLGKMSERDLLLKTLEGITKLSKTEQATAMMNNFGKSFRTVDPGELRDKLIATAGSADKYAESLKRAAELNDNLAKAASSVKIAFLEAFSKPIQQLNDLFASAEKNVQVMADLTTAVKVLGVALVTAFSASVLVGFVATLGTLLRGLSAISAIVGLGTLPAWFIAASGAAARFLPALRAVAILGAAVVGIFAANQIFDDFASVAKNALQRIGEAVLLLGADLLNFVGTPLQKIMTMLNGGVDVGGMGQGLEVLAEKLKKARLESEAYQNSFKRPQATPGEGVAVATGSGIRGTISTPEQMAAEAPPRKIEQADGQAAALFAVKEMTAEYQKQQAAIQNKIAFETSFIGKTAESKELAEAQSKLAEDFLDLQDKLLKKRESLSKEEKAQGVIGKEINNQIEAAAQGFTDQFNALTRVVELQQKKKLQTANEAQEIKNIIELMNKMAQAQEEIAGFQSQQGDAKTQAFEQLKTQKEAFDLLGRREELERSLLNLRDRDKTAALALFDLENDRKTKLEEIQKIQNLPFEGVGGMKQRMEEINATFDARKAKMAESMALTEQEQNSFSFGWTEAFEKYKNSAQTSAEQAKNYFTTFTTGLEDAIVNFVKTGKLSFKDLANTIIAEFVRIQAKQMTMSLFGGGGGGGLLGSLFGGLFGGGGGSAGAAVLGLPGFANGGNISANQLSIIGEKGPELFKPRSAGTVIPNGALGGNTQVTYNIQAVDAASFKSLVASDPEFIFGVSERGRRNLPLRSRL